MPRTMFNSQYGQQIQEATQRQFEKYHCEEGALVKVGNIIYVGIDGEWVQLYPATSGALGLGFQVSIDNEYTVSNPFNFSANIEYLLKNNLSTNKQINLTVYRPNFFQLDALNNMYIITVSFKAHMDNNNAHMEIYLEDFDGNLYQQCSEITIFPKGNGVEHIFNVNFQVYGDSVGVDDGFQVKFKGSHVGSIYGAYYTIQKTQSHE